MKKWLRKCSTSHVQCNSAKKHEKPTRLLSIANGTVRLVFSKDLERVPEYAALSYCWGREPFLTLTEDRLVPFLNEIPFDELPKTFREAISAARELGVEYIWIDALCIIQGQEDSSDWLAEASRMRSVYGGSLVTIAASAATNVHKGLIHDAPLRAGGFSARTTTKTFCAVRSFHSPTLYWEATSETPLSK